MRIFNEENVISIISQWLSEDRNTVAFCLPFSKNKIFYEKSE